MVRMKCFRVRIKASSHWKWHGLKVFQIPNTGSHAIVRTREHTAHTLIGMGSAAPAAVVPYLDKAT